MPYNKGTITLTLGDKMQFRHNSVYERTVPSSKAYDAGLRAYFLKIYNYMGLGLGISAVVAWAFFNVPVLRELAFNPMFRIAILIAELVIVWQLAAKALEISTSRAQALFWTFCALNGAMLSVWFSIYTDASLARAFLVAAITFGSMSLFGYTTKANLTGMGHFMRMGLWGILIAMVINIFVQSSAIHFVTSAIAVVVFTGLTAWDTQRLKITYQHVAGTDMEDKVAINGALTLYLDLINLFIFILQFLGVRRD
jgi:FtsH-binding integral membrane protein